MTSPETRPWQRFERRVRASKRIPLIQVLKTLAAVLLAWFVCLAVFPHQVPLFGAIAALLCVQENVDQSLTRGIERVVGVLIGVSLAIGMGALFGTQSWLFVITLIASLSVGWLLRMSSGASNQIAVSALIMIALGGLQLHFGVERLVETAIGALIGIAINALVVAPVRTVPVHTAIVELSTHAAAALQQLADALAEPRDEAWLSDMYDRATALRDERTEVHTLLRQARESLRLNPRRPRHRRLLEQDDAMFQRLQPIVTQITGMTRALYDLYAPDLVTDPSVIGMVEEMRRAAHDLQLLVDPEAAWGDEPAEPALTAPYTIPRPHPEHWVLIGSLMEDLRRVRGRITGEIE